MNEADNIRMAREREREREEAKRDGRENGILIALLVLVLMAVTGMVTGFVTHKVTDEAWRSEVVRRGHAEYRSDVKGEAVLFWVDGKGSEAMR